MYAGKKRRKLETTAKSKGQTKYRGKYGWQPALLDVKPKPAWKNQTPCPTNFPKLKWSLLLLQLLGGSWGFLGVLGVLGVP